MSTIGNVTTVSIQTLGTTAKSRGIGDKTSSGSIPQLRGSTLGALGIEAIAGQLIVASGHEQSRANRALARESRAEQGRHLMEQHQHLLDKAHATRKQGWTQLVSGVAAAATAMLPAASAAISLTGTGIANCHKADADRSDAHAILAAAKAKFAEGDREDALTIGKQAQGMVDKALGAIAGIAAEQSAARRAVLRAG